MKKLELNQMEIVEGGKFWGWGDWHWKPCVDGVQEGMRVYSAFWLSVDYEETSRAC